MFKKIKLVSKGDKFGFLTVISDKFKVSEGKTKRAFYDVKCDCGSILNTSGTKLRTGIKTSCNNCSFKKRSLNCRSVSQIDQVFRRLVKDRCTSHNIELDITVDDYEKLATSNCYYCNDTPRITNRFNNRKYINANVMYLNGVDRINSEIGYILSNCVSCCTSCNYAKHKLTQKCFYEKIIKIYNNLNLKNYDSKDREELFVLLE